MNSIEEAVAGILDVFDDSGYPAGFLDHYVQLECLASGHGTETFLVRGKDSDKLYIAKCYDKELYSFVHESGILKSLHHEGLPAFADEFQDDKTTCIVREHIEGKPLDQFASENDLDKKDVVEICVQLCDILIYLHGQKEPVIHRDIKPQNIIVKPDGKISLIDFDISRVYRTDAKTDTQFFGTREYAPPEQYGFSQTDSRTDIYSMGVVLGWLLTRETDTKEVASKLGRDRLMSIYRKCTAFSPRDRFVSASKLKSALVQSDGRRQKVTLQRLAAMLSCLVIFSAGFSIGRYTDFLAGILEPHAGIVFKEPLIEEAVRVQLDKSAGEIITEDDLLSVSKLLIFGDSVIAKTDEEFDAELTRLEQSRSMKSGPVRSLADLAKMPNLKHMSVAMQEISDISPLAGLKNLEFVDIRNNPITDLSPLSELKFLKQVCLFDTRVTDLSPLENCPMLYEIDAGKLPIRSTTAFAGFTNLQRLSFYETTLDTLDGIENLTQLRVLEVTGVADGDLTPLLSLPHLTNVILGKEMRGEAEAIEDKAEFSISYK